MSDDRTVQEHLRYLAGNDCAGYAYVGLLSIAVFVIVITASAFAVSAWQRRQRCRFCDGLGYKGHNGPWCWQCNGTGQSPVGEGER